MRYSDFTSEDFIMDDLFKKWVVTPDPSTNDFWERWMEENPHKKKEVEDARKLILGLKYKNYYPTYDIYLKVWDKLNTSIDTHEANKGNKEEVGSELSLKGEKVQSLSVPRRQYKYLSSIAACFIMFGILAITYLLIFKNSRIEITTGSGETQEIVLPDHSIVTINANSKLSYNKNFIDQEVREVWLEGEGFFEVAKREVGQKFKVYGNHLTVEVLGTKFNFSDRQNLARIILNEGKVKLNMEESVQEKEVYMKPGELVEYKVKTNSFLKSKVNPELYNSWTNNVLIFEDTPLESVAYILENNFGYTVEFSDTLMKQKKLVGTFPANNPEELLWNLKKIYGTKVIKEKKYILF